MFFTEGNVLSWATFFPLIGAAAIVVLLAVKFFANLSKRTVDDAVALDRARHERPVVRRGDRRLDDVRRRAGRACSSTQHFVWIRAFNIEYFVGVDGLSISMVLLSGLVSFIATIASMPWWSGAKAARWPGWSTTATTTRTTRSTSRCGWSPATWSCCCSCRPA